MYLFLLIAFWVPQHPESYSKNDILIVTSLSTPIDHITRLQLKQLYLKKNETFHKTKLTPVQLKDSHPLRIVFDQLVLGKHFNIQDYWIKQKFLANEKPPISVMNEAFVLIFIERNEGFIGYVNKGLEGEVKRLGLKVIEVTL